MTYIQIRKKIMKKLGKKFYKITQFFWKKAIVCNYCGRDVGFNSCVSRFGFCCWDCQDKLTRIERRGY